jgi:glycosyltransferase involved in cell wall biosynthesis
MTANHGAAFAWQVSRFFGWGIYGLNLMLHWPHLMVSALPPDRIYAPDKHDARLRRRINASVALQASLAEFAGGKITLRDRAVFVALGNRMERTRAVHGIELSGNPTIGVTFLEDSAVEPADLAKLADLAMIISGSSWNTSLLSAAGVGPVKLVLQGVDTDLFRPRPAKGWHADRFKIFSGGKLEFRKAQDLVLLAFRCFAERHPDALLVTAWHSPWSAGTSHTFAANPDVPLPPLRSDRSIDAPAWGHALGIAPAQIADLGAVPNQEMPNILRDMDLAVFPNRCEGGTNLVAMECLASGVPTILSANTGHLDLIERTGALALTKQTPVSARVPGIRGTEGWGQSDVDEIVAAMEYAYAQRNLMRERAARAAQAMRELSWKSQIRLLYETVSPILKHVP